MTHQRYLFAVAYRLLGSAADAEDAVQEAMLRRHTSAPADLADERAWLTRVTARICLDMLGSARTRRERYVGTWLPEPVAAADDTDIGDVVALRDTARVAVLLVMEQLSPAERVAFVLHEAFGMDFGTIAEVTGRTPAACRQLASRARRRIRGEAPPRDTAAHDRVVAAFLAAAASGDLTELVALLDPGVVMRSDGGGRVPSARPVHGRDGVLALLTGLGRRYADTTGRPIELAGDPALVLYREGVPLAVLSLETVGGRIVALNLVTNPDKLLRVVSPATE